MGDRQRTGGTCCVVVEGRKEKEVVVLSDCHHQRLSFKEREGEGDTKGEGRRFE